MGQHALIDKISREYAAIHDSRHGKIDPSRAGSQYDDYSNVGRSLSLASRANHIVEKQRQQHADLERRELAQRLRLQ